MDPRRLRVPLFKRRPAASLFQKGGAGTERKRVRREAAPPRSRNGAGDRASSDHRPDCLLPTLHVHRHQAPTISSHVRSALVDHCACCPRLCTHLLTEICREAAATAGAWSAGGPAAPRHPRRGCWHRLGAHGGAPLPSRASRRSLGRARAGATSKVHARALPRCTRRLCPRCTRNVGDLRRAECSCTLKPQNPKP